MELYKDDILTLLPGKSIDFFISENDVPKFYKKLSSGIVGTATWNSIFYNKAEYNEVINPAINAFLKNGQILVVKNSDLDSSVSNSRTGLDEVIEIVKDSKTNSPGSSEVNTNSDSQTQILGFIPNTLARNLFFLIIGLALITLITLVYANISKKRK